MAINDILEIGRQGLNANKQALTTTSSNVANANTPGYTRRRPVLETVNPNLSAGGLQIGGGVDVKKVIRVHDAFVQNQLVNETQSWGGLKVRAENLNRIEGILSKDSGQLTDLTNKFFNDFRELSVTPEVSTLRSVTLGSANSLVNSVKSMNDSIEGMRRDLDLRIGDAVEQVNVRTKEIANLNDGIALCEARGDVPNDMYDKRDVLMKELAQKIDFQMNTDQFGHINIVSAGNVLVQGNTSVDMYVVRSAAREGKQAESVDVFVRNHGGGRQVTGNIKDGEIGGMLQVRDKVLKNAQEHLDSIAFQISNSTNEIHKQGMGMNGTSGRGLFSDLKEAKGAAALFSVNEEIKNNHELIATGLSIETPGDNQIALRIADLQNSKMMKIGGLAGGAENHTINDSISSMMGKIGVETQKENNFFSHQQAVVEQLENYRESISGVSLEEEAVNLVKYQTAFNASAKAMKVGEELFKIVLSLKE